MATAFFYDHGIRFEYPPSWDIDVTDDGPRSTVSIQSPGGLAFAMVTVDEERPEPASVADEALAAMKEEYPTLEVVPAIEDLLGEHAVGHDLEFVSLDMLNVCEIRCFRTPRRTILVFGQWSEADADEEEPEVALRGLKRTLEETDS